MPKLAGLPIGVLTGIAFLVGAACSMASGIIGMLIPVKANVRISSLNAPHIFNCLNPKE